MAWTYKQATKCKAKESKKHIDKERGKKTKEKRFVRFNWQGAFFWAHKPYSPSNIYTQILHAFHISVSSDFSAFKYKSIYFFS